MSHNFFPNWSLPYRPPVPGPDQIFRAAFTPTHMGNPIVAPHGPQAQTEWREGPEAHVFKAHIHGVRPHEVKVELEENERVLCVTAEKKVAREETKDTWHQFEYSAGRFVQRLKLPENARVDHVRACMDNGVLTITVPKYEVSTQHHQDRRPRVINVSGH